MTFNVTTAQPGDTLSATELELYRLIMDYRAAAGAAPIPLSSALTTTAGRHAADWVENIWRAGVTMPADTNLHSWSDAPYHADNSTPEVMWNAPERIGTGYLGDGFEISAAGYSSVASTFKAWTESAAHDDLLLGRGDWAAFPFTAIGIGVEIDPTAGGLYGGRIYHIWFGSAEDQTPRSRIEWGDGDDAMELTAFADDAAGGDGNDTLSGLDGDDTLDGGAGDDSLLGGAGDDLVIGGRGRDTALLGAGDDIYRDHRQGGTAGADLVKGGAGADRIATGGGADRLIGQAGADTLSGGAGQDTLSGGAQADRLTGGAGDDVLRGGAGPDSFVFRGSFGADRIADFGRGDSIEITGAAEARSMAALTRALTEVKGGVLYDAGHDGANTILFTGLSLDDLTPEMFGL